MDIHRWICFLVIFFLNKNRPFKVVKTSHYKLYLNLQIRWSNDALLKHHQKKEGMPKKRKNIGDETNCLVLIKFQE